MIAYVCMYIYISSSRSVGRSVGRSVFRTCVREGGQSDRRVARWIGWLPRAASLAGRPVGWAFRLSGHALLGSICMILEGGGWGQSNHFLSFGSGFVSTPVLLVLSITRAAQVICIFIGSQCIYLQGLCVCMYIHHLYSVIPSASFSLIGFWRIIS